MKSRYLYIAAGVAFLAGAVFELRPPRGTTATVLDMIAAVIFLFLGFSPPRTGAKPPDKD